MRLSHLLEHSQMKDIFMLLSQIKMDGHVVGGHVMGNMKVFTTAEVVIGNCDMLSFTREIDDETGFDELVVKEKV